MQSQLNIFYSNKVTALCYASAERVLLSGGEDGVIVCWDMAANRKETAAWIESDTCQVCNCKIIINLILKFNATTSLVFYANYDPTSNNILLYT